MKNLQLKKRGKRNNGRTRQRHFKVKKTFLGWFFESSVQGECRIYSSDDLQYFMVLGSLHQQIIAN